MYPYTVRGLEQHILEAKMGTTEEDEDSQDQTETTHSVPQTQHQPGSDPLLISPTLPDSPSQEEHSQCTRYTLRGVVVHSGQAGGGHYYSFIRQYCSKTKTYRWYKYDDTEVNSYVIPSIFRFFFWGVALMQCSKHPFTIETISFHALFLRYVNIVRNLERIYLFPQFLAIVYLLAHCPAIHSQSRHHLTICTRKYTGER